MGYMSRCRSIGGRSHTSLIAEKSPFNPLHQSRSYSATNGLMPAKSIADNLFNNCWNTVNISQYNKQSQCNITDSHDRNNDTTDGSNTMYTSKNNDKG